MRMEWQTVQTLTEGVVWSGSALFVQICLSENFYDHYGKSCNFRMQIIFHDIHEEKRFAKNKLPGKLLQYLHMNEDFVFVLRLNVPVNNIWLKNKILKSY